MEKNNDLAPPAKRACIVLPTYNEAGNVQKLLPAIFAQAEKISGYELHVLVVDDNSPDGTARIVQDLETKFPNLHLVTGEKRGLGEAYKRGMAFAIGLLNPDFIIEMDADLQHDPNMIPLFLNLADHGFSVIIGSRFAFGGSTPNFSLHRRALSLTANWMLRFVGGMPPIRDYTSGFRCIKTDILQKCDLSFLSTKGYSFQSSLLFELIGNGGRVIEVPITFPDRMQGKSKLGFADQVEFLLNIFKIRFRKSEEFITFCVVGISGILVNLGIYYLLTRKLLLPLEYASPIAIECSILSNFSLNNAFTFRGRKVETGFLKRLFRFHTAALAAGIVNYVLLLVFAKAFGIWDILSNLIGIAGGTLINYLINSRWTWKHNAGGPGKEMEVDRTCRGPSKPVEK